MDGDRLISGDFGGVLQLWDAKRGQPIGVPLQGDAKSVWSVAFSPDGIHIVSGGEDRKLHIRYAPKFELNLVCAKLTRNMSRQEWRDWVSPKIDYECQCPGLPIPPDDPASGAEPEMCPPADA
ncbi:hypothetical protein E0E53_15695 [Azotobacter chroococcum]|nr:hypothetical protein E0E53_15695 [Azotobacter chroococcum]